MLKDTKPGIEQKSDFSRELVGVIRQVVREDSSRDGIWAEPWMTKRSHLYFNLKDMYLQEEETANAKVLK